MAEVPLAGYVPVSPKKCFCARRLATIPPVALEAVRRIDALFDVERGLNGLSAEVRLRVRQEQSAPVVAELRFATRSQSNFESEIREHAARKRQKIYRRKGLWLHST